MTDWLEYRWYAYLAVLGGSAVLLMALGVGVRTSLLLAFDIAGATFLTALSLTMWRGGAAAVRENARRIDAGRWVVLLISILLSATALIALALEIQAARHASTVQILVGASSILIAWLFMNTIFALHYAHAYFTGENEPQRGLEFPGPDIPDYFDFLYFALVLGMTFQVSDVTITSSRVRRVALAHAVIAFFFNVVVLALSVSLLGSVM